ncbi:hypothetical protein LUZ60_001871 [Juncus effusus]|nr:hypothetical protein LUZ60_001871 [Juncus effusus]
MPVEMPKGLPFAVDTWSGESDRKSHWFLTHAHRDHLACIVSHASYPIYATRLTISLVLNYFPEIDEGAFVEISVGETLTINDPDGAFSVSAFDANHCPGAVMFLFEGVFGNILHTGDCRLSPECIQNLPLKYLAKRGKETIHKLDFIFLDCTFSRCFLPLPSKQSAIQQVISCIWKHPNAPFIYLACDLLGHEEILIQVSETFGSKIFVDSAKYPKCYRALSHTAPQIISNDPSSRFQIIGFPGLRKNAESAILNSFKNLQSPPLFIRTSTQWYAMQSKNKSPNPILTEALQDEIGIHHICFSIHSSRDELESFLELLQPKWVVSTTPPNFAMDLSYVRRNCYTTRLRLDDPLWRILRLEVVKKTVSVPDLIERESFEQLVPLEKDEEILEPIEIELEITPPITLFGRARFGLLDDECEVLDEEKSEYISCEGIDDLSDGESLDKGKSEYVSCSCEESSLLLDGEKFSDSNRGLEVVRKSTEELEVQERENKGREKNEERENKGREKNEERENREQVLIEDGKYDGERVNKASSDVGKIEEVRESNVVEFERGREFCVGSSKNLNESLRRLYRSRNVPVPRPLPSLIELMEASKRVKMGYKSPNYRALHSSYSLP